MIYRYISFLWLRAFMTRMYVLISQLLICIIFGIYFLLLLLCGCLTIPLYGPHNGAIVEQKNICSFILIFNRCLFILVPQKVIGELHSSIRGILNIHRPIDVADCLPDNSTKKKYDCVSACLDHNWLLMLIVSNNRYLFVTKLFIYTT